MVYVSQQESRADCPVDLKGEIQQCLQWSPHTAWCQLSSGWMTMAQALQSSAMLLLTSTASSGDLPVPSSICFRRLASDSSQVRNRSVCTIVPSGLRRCQGKFSQWSTTGMGRGRDQHRWQAIFEGGSHASRHPEAAGGGVPLGAPGS